MAEKELTAVTDSVAKLSERFQRLETLVEDLAREQCSSGYGAASGIDNAGRRHVDREEEPTPSAAVSSYTELQSEFRAIKESVAKIKLPADLIVGDSRTGVSRADLPKFNVLQKSARFQETALKLLSTLEDGSQPALSALTTVALAHLRYLQEEYTNLLVSSQFDEGTSKLFATLQQNPAAFSTSALENLHRAVAIAGARPQRQIGASVTSRGRGLPPVLGFGRGGGRGSGYSGRGYGFGFGQYRWPGPGAVPAARGSGRPDLAGSRDFAGRPSAGREDGVLE